MSDISFSGRCDECKDEMLSCKQEARLRVGIFGFSIDPPPARIE